MGKRKACRRRGREYWRRVIAKQAASGQTAKGYCAARDLGTSSFFKWKKVFSREGKGRPGLAGFARVVLKERPRQAAPAAKAGGLEIETPGGWLIRVGADCDEASLRRAVSALGGGSCC